MWVERLRRYQWRIAGCALALLVGWLAWPLPTGQFCLLLLAVSGQVWMARFDQVQRDTEHLGRGR